MKSFSALKTVKCSKEWVREMEQREIREAQKIDTQQPGGCEASSLF
jgi:hypothetical protein